MPDVKRVFKILLSDINTEVFDFSIDGILSKEYIVMSWVPMLLLQTVKCVKLNQVDKIKLLLLKLICYKQNECSETEMFRINIKRKSKFNSLLKLKVKVIKIINEIIIFAEDLN